MRLKCEGKAFPLPSHGDWEGRRNVVLPSSLWNSAQMGQQSCDLYAQGALCPQGNSLVLISVRGWAYPRSNERREKEQGASKFPRILMGGNPKPPVLCRSATNKRATDRPKLRVSEDLKWFPAAQQTSPSCQYAKACLDPTSLYSNSMVSLMPTG
jgi:hypothetical protein